MKISMTSWKEKQLVRPVNMCVCMCIDQDRNVEA